VHSGPEGDVLAVVRPEALVPDPGGAPGVVLDRWFHGHDQVLRVQLGGGPVLRWRHAGRGGPRPGERVALRVEGDVSVLSAAHDAAGTAR
jgi:iron(III) transport system ATP-binding protein